MRSVADEPCGDDSPIFVRKMTGIFKDAFKTFPPKTKRVTQMRMNYIKDHVLSNNGPYTMIPNEIAKNMEPIIKQWANKTNARIERMYKDLRNVLFKSLDGKQMSDDRREQVGPGIKREMEKTIDALRSIIDGYPADFL